MSNDTQLKQDVVAELSWEPSITSAHIGVTAHDGIVTLSGHVKTFLEKHAAESAAQRVKGVKGVAEEIEVRLPFEMNRGDEEIAAAASSRIAWDVSVPRDSVKVKAEKGWITLSGQVDWNYQKEAAGKDVHGLYGVIGVMNEISIKQRINAAVVSDDIRHALHRSTFLDPRQVTVSAHDGEVRLSGTVHSWHDRDVAANIAWAAPGVTTLVNDIVIV